MREAAVLLAGLVFACPTVALIALLRRERRRAGPPSPWLPFYRVVTFGWLLIVGFVALWTIVSLSQLGPPN